MDSYHNFRRTILSGTNKVENKEVVRLGKTAVRAGSGPRQMVVHDQRKLVFLVGELMSLVEVYRYSSKFKCGMVVFNFTLQVE